jgi:isopentenyldiphosphate isomerase
MVKIAIVNDQDEIIGAAEKTDARRQGLIHRTARALLHDGRGNILLQRRGPGAADAPGRWDFSAAGHVDQDEDYDVAMRREMKEELGLSGVAVRPLFKFYSDRMNGAERLRRFNTVFLGQVDPQAVHPNLEELDGVEWFPAGKAAAMIHDAPDDFTTGLRDTYTQIMSYLVPTGERE